MYWRHAHPLTAATAEAQGVRRVQPRDRREGPKWLDRELADGRAFLAGETYSIADIAAQTTIDFATSSGLDGSGEAKHVRLARADGGGPARRPSFNCPSAA
jgi:glutathione S-transferase